jgi:pyruvate kinase
MDYLTLRRHDIRHLQSKLAALGLSSLGRTEPHVLSSLHTVLNILLKLAGSVSISPAPKAVPRVGQGNHLLDRNTEALFGKSPTDRHVRIMVTMPPEAATKYELVRDLLVQGMDCMRINCAHDGPEAWSGMIRNLRRAEKETNKHCKVAMDLAGPKPRTGPIEPGTYGIEVSPAERRLRPCSFPGADLADTRFQSGSSTCAGGCRRASAPTLAGAAETARSGTFQRRARGVSFDDHLGS